MISSDDRKRTQRWSRSIEALARCAWLLALLLVAGTALSRAHAQDPLRGPASSLEASVSPEFVGFEAWDAVATLAPGRVSLSVESSSTFLDTVLEDEPNDVGGPEESEAEAAPEALASASSRSGSARGSSPVGEAALRTFVHGPYAARAPPRLA